MTNRVVTRFAPSPTGYLHLGGARTALFNWLYARHLGGKNILRIEDTDVERSTQRSADGILESLKWLGLAWDEGPYYQSERLGIYRDNLATLVAKGLVYPAFDTAEELEAMRAKAQAEKRNPIYDRNALKLSKDEVEGRMARGDAFVWRFKVPDHGITEVPELLMGSDKTGFPNDALGDFIITRPGTVSAPGMPLYNFVCAVDDGLMGITHVIRGVEHFSNAARQVLLHGGLGNTTPTFVHLPLITRNGKKMSKRDPDPDGKQPVSIEGRQALGYLPDALLNYLVLLGWSHPDGKEMLSLAEMVDAFDLDRLSKANANFDEKKLLHFNSQYLAAKPLPELVEAVTPFLRDAGLPVDTSDPAWLSKIIELERGRSKLLSEFPAALAHYFARPTEFPDEAMTFDLGVGVRIVDTVREGVSSQSPFEVPEIQKLFDETVASLAVPYKTFGAVIRLALTGSTKSPALPDLVVALGRDETLVRLAHFRDVIGTD